MNSSRWNGARCHGGLRSLYFKRGIRYLHFGCTQLNLTFPSQYLDSKREQTWQTWPSVIGIKISPSLTCHRTKLRAMENPGRLVGVVGGATAAPWAGNTKQGRQRGENTSKCRFKKCPLLKNWNIQIGRLERMRKNNLQRQPLVIFQLRASALGFSVLGFGNWLQVADV